MKAFGSLLWACSIVATLSSTHEASLYLPDSPSHNAGSRPSISPNVARLLLAQRLGLAQYHELGDVDESTIEILNGYSGEQQPLFSASERKPEKLLIAEGVVHPEGDIPYHCRFEPKLKSKLDLFDISRGQPDMTISDFPSSSATRRFASDLLGQSEHQGSEISIEYIPSLADLTRSSPSYATALTSLQTLLTNSLSTTPGTILLLTPPSTYTSPSSTFGTYTPPHALLHQNYPRQEESVLQNPAEDAPQSSSSSSSTAPSPTPPTRPSESSTPSPLPHGILPICHPSLESLIASTNNCSGHGIPYQKHTSPSDTDEKGEGGAKKECFACKCQKTVIDVEGGSGGKKTIFWGGAACQKKDVSSSFWLLVGVTVGLLGVSAWGIGLMYSIGEQELPGVLGAGVAGPRAHRD